MTWPLIKVALCAGAFWLAYHLVSSAPHLQRSPGPAFAILALSLTVAAYAAMRQQTGRAAPPDDAGVPDSPPDAAEAMAITDGQGIVRFINPAYTKLTGYSPSEVIGRNPAVDDAVFGAAFDEHVRRALATGATSCAELISRRKDGSLYLEAVSATAVRDGQGKTHQCILHRRDVTEHKSADEVAAFYASIVESSEDAILSSTPDGLITNWNRGAERLYGYSAAEVIGKPVSLLVPGDQRSHLKWIGEKLDRGESVGHMEGVGLTKHGTRIHVSISACPIRGRHGRIIARAAIIRDVTARVQAQEARALLAAIVDSADDAIFGADAAGAILSWNKGAEILYGYSAGEIVGSPVGRLFPAASKQRAGDALERVRGGETISQWETITIDRAGAPVDVSLTISPVRNPAGDVVGTSAIARDISRRRRDREALRESEEKYRMLVANLPDMVFAADESGQVVFISDNCRQITGYDPEQICRPGSWAAHVHPEDLPRARAAYEVLFRSGRTIDTEYRLMRADGEWIWLHSRAVSTYERDGTRYRTGLLSDITARKRMEQKLAYQATHDLLTGLPNRAAFEDRFSDALARARRGDSVLALLYVDLDRFRRINDTLGHLAGDSLIQMAAERLAGCLRRKETLARSGGDQFMLVVDDLRDAAEAAQVAERLRAALSTPFSVKGHEIFLSASMGVALYPRDGQDVPTLERAADLALNAARRQGRERNQVSTAEVGEAPTERLAIETELHYALARGELSVHYQPQFDLATNRVTGLEALVRWQNSRFGPVPPSVLIPIAEESGLIVPIGEQVLREACRQAKAWTDAGYGAIHVGVNTSAVQFTHGGLARTVSDILAETGLRPECLDLEVTESVIMQDMRETVRQLNQLKQLGVSVSLDDFGTGYSSLSYLEELPIDNLKIDRRFVQRMNGADNTSTLVQSIVGLAHSLGMRAVAEGVETDEQLGQLRAMGCDRAQSFMLGVPAPAPRIQELLSQSTYVA